jgi:hypothetical protein
VTTHQATGKNLSISNFFVVISKQQKCQSNAWEEVCSACHGPGLGPHARRRAPAHAP